MNSLNEASNSGFSPYGTGNTSRSPIIAISEAWGGHAGMFFSDLRYGLQAPCQSEQRNPANPNAGLFFCNLGGQGAFRRVLENWNPANAADNFRWIPKGLMLDLIDAQNENVPVIDRVTGYTNAQLFDALDADVQSVPAYEARLLQENGNNQQAQMDDLFQEYGY